MIEHEIITLFVILAAFVVSASSANIQSTEDVTVTANPASMHEGFTKDLSLNCSFVHDAASDFTSLMSLILSKTDEGDASVYTEIASLASGSPDNVIIKESLGGQVSGRLITNGESFISYKWSYPTADVKGHYKCEAFGMESTGHPRTSSATTNLSEKTVDIEVLLARIKEIDLLQTEQTKKEEYLQKQINDHTLRFEDARAALIQDTMTFQGHEYLLSYPVWRNGYVSDFYCRMFGAYLVEISDDREFEMVYNFLKRNNAREYIQYGGSDEGHDGRWVYQRSGEPVTYFKWASGQPNGGTSSNCLGMDNNLIHGMNDLNCRDSSWSRFVCEVEL